MICVFITLVSFGQVLLKKALAGKTLMSGSVGGTFVNIVRSMFHPYMIVGLTLYVLGTFIWLLVLSRVRLSVAYPMMSLSYFMVVGLSWAVLRERIDWRFAAIGLLLICAGVSFIGFGMGR